MGEYTGLTPRQEQAALEVALDQLTDKEIATKAGITEEGLRKWKKRPEFVERIGTLRAAFSRAVEGRGIAQKEARLQELQNLFDGMKDVRTGRAEELGNAPGGMSGLLVRQYKQVGRDDFREEYVFDAALVREMRATLQHVAQELGQWTEKRETKTDLRVQDLDAAIAAELADLAGGTQTSSTGEAATEERGTEG